MLTRMGLSFLGMVANWAARGAVVLGLLGAVVGLIVGLITYAPTAGFGDVRACTVPSSVHFWVPQAEQQRPQFAVAATEPPFGTSDPYSTFPTRWTGPLPNGSRTYLKGRR